MKYILFGLMLLLSINIFAYEVTFKATGQASPESVQKELIDKLTEEAKLPYDFFRITKVTEEVNKRHEWFMDSNITIEVSGDTKKCQPNDVYKILKFNNSIPNFTVGFLKKAGFKVISIPGDEWEYWIGIPYCLLN